MAHSSWHALYVYFLRTFLGLIGPWIWRQRSSIIIYQLVWRDIPEDLNLPSDISWQFATTTRNSLQLRNKNRRCFAHIRHFIDKYNIAFSTVLKGHCATSRKVAGSIPDGVIGIFHWHNPSGRTMTLESTQPLTEMSTRNVSWRVKAAGA